MWGTQHDRNMSRYSCSLIDHLLGPESRWKELGSRDTGAVFVEHKGLCRARVRRGHWGRNVSL